MVLTLISPSHITAAYFTGKTKRGQKRVNESCGRNTGEAWCGPLSPPSSELCPVC